MPDLCKRLTTEYTVTTFSLYGSIEIFQDGVGEIARKCAESVADGA